MWYTWNFRIPTKLYNKVGWEHVHGGGEWTAHVYPMITPERHKTKRKYDSKVTALQDCWSAKRFNFHIFYLYYFQLFFSSGGRSHGVKIVLIKKAIYVLELQHSTSSSRMTHLQIFVMLNMYKQRAIARWIEETDENIQLFLCAWFIEGPRL